MQMRSCSRREKQSRGAWQLCRDAQAQRFDEHPSSTNLPINRALLDLETAQSFIHPNGNGCQASLDSALIISISLRYRSAICMALIKGWIRESSSRIARFGKPCGQKRPPWTGVTPRPGTTLEGPGNEQESSADDRGQRCCYIKRARDSRRATFTRLIATHSGGCIFNGDRKTNQFCESLSPTKNRGFRNRG
jgi:hypothetical protein